VSKVAVGIAVIIVLCAGWDLAARLSDIVIGIGQAQAQVEIEPFNDLEKMLMNYALQHLDGGFIVYRLAQSLAEQGIALHQVQKVAEHSNVALG